MLTLEAYKQHVANIESLTATATILGEMSLNDAQEAVCAATEGRKYKLAAALAELALRADNTDSGAGMHHYANNIWAALGRNEHITGSNLDNLDWEVKQINAKLEALADDELAADDTPNSTIEAV